MKGEEEAGKEGRRSQAMVQVSDHASAQPQLDSAEKLSGCICTKVLIFLRSIRAGPLCSFINHSS